LQELAKPLSRRKGRNTGLELSTSEPWDTVKSQLLVKVASELSPAKLDYSHYDVMVYIPRILPKPGMPLITPENYASLSARVNNMSTLTPTVNITIEEKTPTAASEDGKENQLKEGQTRNDDSDNDSDTRDGKKKKKKVVFVYHSISCVGLIS
jgi:hypothetical protein